MADKWSGSDSPIDISEILNSSALYLANSVSKSDEWLSSDTAIKNLNQSGFSTRVYDIGSLFPENDEMINIGPFHNVSVLIRSEPESESSVIALIPDTQDIVDPNLLRVAHGTKSKDMKTKRPVPVVDSSSACSNCGTTETTLWRRTEGRLMCNPCALYFKLHGVSRPLHLLNGSIRRRRRRNSGRT